MPRGFPDWKEFAPQKSLEQLLREGNGFAVYNMVTPVIGKFSMMQLWNPVDSGVACYVYSVEFQLDTAGRGYLTTHNVEFLTASNPGKNRFVGDPDSQAVYHIEAKDALVGDYQNHQYQVQYHTGDWTPTYIWIPEGHGMIVTPAAKNVQLACVMIWFEFTDW